MALETPGVRILRNLPIMSHYAVEGHCEVLLRDVFVPINALLGEEGAGFSLALRTADRIDREGNRAARIDVSAIKLLAGRLQTTVLDRAMQVFGAMGLTQDTPLAFLWSWGRALRFVDGPDEVHWAWLRRPNWPGASSKPAAIPCTSRRRRILSSTKALPGRFPET